jgi:hypothetical protein
MCAIGRNLDTSVGANSPASTMLGGASIGAGLTPARRNTTLLTGAPTTGTGAGKPGGTAPAPKAPPRKLEMLE